MLFFLPLLAVRDYPSQRKYQEFDERLYTRAKLHCATSQSVCLCYRQWNLKLTSLNTVMYVADPSDFRWFLPNDNVDEQEDSPVTATSSQTIYDCPKPWQKVKGLNVELKRP